jgi:hypothetical protein
MPRRTLPYGRIEPGQSERVCELCRGMTADTLSSDVGYPHAMTTNTLKENGENGCRICSELFQTVYHLDNPKGRLFLSVEPSEFEKNGQQLIYRFGSPNDSGPIIWESIPSRRPSDKSSRNRFADGICVYTDEGYIHVVPASRNFN